MSWLKDTVGDLAGGLASNILGGAVNNFFGNAAMDYQAGINERFYKNRYKWTRESLENSGFNPILAAMGGLGSSAPSVGISGAGATDVASSYMGARTAQKAQKSLQDLQNSQIENNKANTAKSKAEALFIDTQDKRQKLENEIRDAVKPYIIEEAMNSAANSAKTGKLIEEQIKTTGYNGLAALASAAQSNSSARLYGAQADLADLESEFYTGVYDKLGIPKSTTAGVGGVISKGLDFLFGGAKARAAKGVAKAAKNYKPYVWKRRR